MRFLPTHQLASEDVPYTYVCPGESCPFIISETTITLVAGSPPGRDLLLSEARFIPAKKRSKTGLTLPPKSEYAEACDLTDKKGIGVTDGKSIKALQKITAPEMVTP